LKNYSFSFDVDNPEKAKFEKPVLLLAGRQDAVTGYRDTWSILEHYPRASYAVLDAAGHHLQIEQPELFSRLVSEWIARAEGRFGI
jgi:pimeloyl-ACP methyl ester carboxylesterase